MIAIEIVNYYNSIKGIMHHSKYKYSYTKNEEYMDIVIESTNLLHDLSITYVDGCNVNIKQKYTELYLKYKLVESNKDMIGREIIKKDLRERAIRYELTKMYSSAEVKEMFNIKEGKVND